MNKNTQILQEQVDIISKNMNKKYKPQEYGYNHVFMKWRLDRLNKYIELSKDPNFIIWNYETL